jgi:hypothetical protein
MSCFCILYITSCSTSTLLHVPFFADFSSVDCRKSNKEYPKPGHGACRACIHLEQKLASSETSMRNWHCSSRCPTAAATRTPTCCCSLIDPLLPQGALTSSQVCAWLINLVCKFLRICSVSLLLDVCLLRKSSHRWYSFEMQLIFPQNWRNYHAWSGKQRFTPC